MGEGGHSDGFDSKSRGPNALKNEGKADASG